MHKKNIARTAKNTPTVFLLCCLIYSIVHQYKHPITLYKSHKYKFRHCHSCTVLYYMVLRGRFQCFTWMRLGWDGWLSYVIGLLRAPSPLLLDILNSTQIQIPTLPLLYCSITWCCTPWLLFNIPNLITLTAFLAPVPYHAHHHIFWFHIFL